MHLTIIQTCAPHYRLPFFDELERQVGKGKLTVYAGEHFYGGTLKTKAADQSWYRPCKNHFFAKDRFLWQSGISLPTDCSHLVVEGNPRSLSSWKIIREAKRRGIRIAIWGHALGRGSAEMARIRKRLFNLGDAILCYCYNEAPRLKALFPEKQILVCGNTVIRESECIPISGNSNMRSKVLFIGRMIPQKKGKLLLEALVKIQKQGYPIGAVFIGSGPSEDCWKAYSKECGLQGVEFCGEVTELDLIRDLAKSCFMMASPGYVGLSVLHSLSMGLPVVYSKEEPNSPEVEVVETGNHSLSFEKDNQPALADVIIKMYKERSAYLHEAALYSKCLKENYTIERMAEQFSNFTLA